MLNLPYIAPDRHKWLQFGLGERYNMYVGMVSVVQMAYSTTRYRNI